MLGLNITPFLEIIKMGGSPNVLSAFPRYTLCLGLSYVQIFVCLVAGFLLSSRWIFVWLVAGFFSV